MRRRELDAAVVVPGAQRRARSATWELALGTCPLCTPWPLGLGLGLAKLGCGGGGIQGPNLGESCEQVPRKASLQPHFGTKHPAAGALLLL